MESIPSTQAISLNIPQPLLESSTKHAKELRLSRAEYIRQAIDRMNQEVEASMRAQRLSAASRKVREESLRINREFDAIDTLTDDETR